MADAPDGGWGWVIVAAVTIISLAVLPLQQCFGLIFEEQFSILGITATQAALILHLNSTITCSLGLISGPMMNKFSFRTVACFGSFVIVTGICSTAFVNSLTAIIVTYSIFMGVGHGIMYPATSLALNTYFRTKRSIAMGISVTLTGLGPIFMPQLIASLLESYATSGTVLILGGIATHAFVGAVLLRPLENNQALDISWNDSPSTSRDTNHNTNDKDIEMGDMSSKEAYVRPEETKLIPSGCEGAEIVSTTDNSTEIKTTEESAKIMLKTNHDQKRTTEEGEEFSEKPSSSFTEIWKNTFSNIATSLDLGLLSDNSFLIIVLGMSVSFVAELNFNLVTPFVLAELAGLERADVATVMSVQAAADITGRLCVPLLAQKAGWSSRNLYIASLLGSTVGRTILSVWSSSYSIVIGLSLILGVAKGTKAVFQALVVPDYVPLARLPAASGLLMVCNGILSIAFGPLIGMVHDLTHSYVGSLHLTSCLSMACVFLWIGERIWASRRPTHRGNKTQIPNQLS